MSLVQVVQIGGRGWGGVGEFEQNPQEQHFFVITSVTVYDFVQMCEKTRAFHWFDSISNHLRTFVAN